MRRLPLTPLQQEIVFEIGRTISAGEAVVAASAMRILSAYAGPSEDCLWSLSSNDIERMFDQRGTSDTTKVRQLTTLRKIYEVAVLWDLIPVNPIDGVHRPKIESKSSDFNVDETLIDAVIAHWANAVAVVHCNLTPTRMLLKLAVLYVVSFGAFLAEVPGILARDLCLDGLVVGRNSFRERKLWLSPDGLAAVRNYQSTQALRRPALNQTLLFLNGVGKPFDTKLVWQLLQEVIGEAGAAGRDLTPAKLHRSPVRSIAESGLGWDTAAHFGGYRKIPVVEAKPYTAEELATFIDRFHPMSSVQPQG